MNKKLFLCLFALAAVITQAQVKTNISWVNFLSDDATINAVSTGIDGASKVYSTGRVLNVTEDIVVQCTDSAGAVLWTYPYDNGGYDSPTRIRVDAAGFSYVSGQSYDPVNNNYDYVVIKLDPTGSMVWVCRYDNGINQDDFSTDVVMRSNGDVYATGRCMNNSGDLDAVTIKIDGNTGGVIWKDTRNSAAQNDKGTCLTLANNEADLIVGADCEIGGNFDIVIYKLDANTGTAGWVQQIGGSNNSTDHVSSIILAGGNIVFAGMLDNAGAGQDYCLTKLDASSGAVVFQKDYDFSNTDYATSLVRDSTGNIVVTGVVEKAGLYEYHTQLYDSTGTLHWTHKQATNCAALNVDPVVVCDTIVHHFYVSGETENASRDILVYQLTPGGNLGWEKTYDAPSNGTDAATSLVVNGLGLVFVSANTTNSGSNFDIATMRITQTPVYYPIDFNNANEPPAPNALYYKNTGEILYRNQTPAPEVEFYTKNTAPQLFIRKNSLSFLTRSVDTLGNDSTDRIDMDFKYASPFSEISWFETQNDGYLNYFKPHCGGASGITDVKGSRRLMVPEIYRGVDLHYYSNKDGLKLYFVIKPSYSPNLINLHFDGSSLVTALNGSNELSVTSNLSQIRFKAPKIYSVMAALSGTNVTFTTTAVSGVIANVSGNDYKFTVSAYNGMWPLVICLEQKELELSSATECDWSTFWGGTGIDEATNVITDASGNSFFIGQNDSPNFPSLTGGWATTTAGKDAFLVKINPNGAGVWGTFYGGNAIVGAVNAIPYGVGLNSSGQIYICGATDNATLPIVPSSTYGLQGGTDGFIAQFNSTGNSLLFSRYIGSTGSDAANDLTIDANDNVYVGGQAGGTTGLPLTNPGSGAYFQNASSDNNDGFIAKFSTSNTLSWLTLFGGQNSNGGDEAIQSIKALPNGNLLAAGITNASVRASSNLSNPPCGVPLSATDFPDCTPSGAYSQPYGGDFEDHMIVELDANGALVWSTLYGGAGKELSAKIALVPNVSNDFYLYGSTSKSSGGLSNGLPGSYIQNFNPNGNLPRGFVARFYNRDNTWTWHTLIGEGSQAFSSGGVCDNNGNFYIAGRAIPTGYTSGATCTQVPLANYLTDFPKCFPSGMFSQSSYGGGQNGDAYLMCFKSNPAFGNPSYMGPYEMQWSTLYGAGGGDFGQALAFDAATNKLVFVGHTTSSAGGFPLRDPAIGNYQQNVNAGSATSPLYTGANVDCFVAKFCLNTFSPVGIKEQSRDEYASALLYPNPNDGSFELKFSDAAADKYQYDIYDVVGKKVDQGTVSKENSFKVDATGKGLKQGIYFLNLRSENTQYKFKFVVQ